MVFSQAISEVSGEFYDEIHAILTDSGSSNFKKIIIYIESKDNDGESEKIEFVFFKDSIIRQKFSFGLKHYYFVEREGQILSLDCKKCKFEETKQNVAYSDSSGYKINTYYEFRGTDSVFDYSRTKRGSSTNIIHYYGVRTIINSNGEKEIKVHEKHGDSIETIFQYLCVHDTCIPEWSWKAVTVDVGVSRTKTITTTRYNESDIAEPISQVTVIQSFYEYDALGRLVKVSKTNSNDADLASLMKSEMRVKYVVNNK